MKNTRNGLKGLTNRRSFIKKGFAAGTATVGAGFVAHADERGGAIGKGDAAILRFLSAAEIIETDVWQQYNELGGIPDSEVPGGTGSAPYIAALSVLDAIWTSTYTTTPKMS